jgi:WD40 repeat protein
MVAGDAQAGELLMRIQAQDDSVMPPDDNPAGARRLTPDEIARVAAWAAAGALPSSGAAPSGPSWQPVAPTYQPAYGIAATTDGQWLVASRGQRAVVVRWPVADGIADAFPLVDETLAPLNPESLAAAHLDVVQSVAISPDGQRVATGGYRDVKIWRRRAGVAEARLAELLRGSTALAASPDGARIARGTRSRTIEVVRTDDPVVLVRLVCHEDPLALSWSPDGARLAALSSDGTLQLYDVPQGVGEEIPNVAPLTATPAPEPLQSLALLDSRTFWGVTTTGVLKHWAWSDDGSGGWGPPSSLPELEMAGVVAATSCVGAAGPSVATVDAQGQVQVVPLGAGSPLEPWGHGGPVVALLSVAEGNHLVTVGVDGSVKAWRAADGALLWEQRDDYRRQQHRAQAQAVAGRQRARLERLTAQVPELERLRQAEIDAQAKQETARQQVAEEVKQQEQAVATEDQAVATAEAAVAAAEQAAQEAAQRLQQARDELAARRQQRETVAQKQADAVRRLELADKARAAAAEAIARSEARLAERRQTVEREQQQLVELDAAAQAAAEAGPRAPALRAIASVDQRFVATLHEDGTLHVLRADTGQPAAAYEGGLGDCVGLVATAQGDFVGASADGRAALWRAGNVWELERILGGGEDSPFSDRVTALDFSPNGQVLAVGGGAPSRFGELKLVGVADGSVVRDFGPVHSDAVLAVRFSPDGALLATGAADRVARLHRVEGEAPLRTLEGHTHHVLALAWHADGYLLATGGADNAVRIWDIDGEAALRTVTGFGKEASALAFAARTSQLASASVDGGLRLHDANNGALIRTFSGPQAALYSAAILEQGAAVAAGDHAGNVWLWRLDAEAPVGRLAE